MPSPRKPAPAPPLSPSVEAQLAQLTDAVKALAVEVGGIRDVLDEIRDDFGWALSNGAFKSREPRTALHITSMPNDPCAPDFGKRVNQFTPQNAPEAFAVPAPSPEPAAKKQPDELF